MPRRTLLYTLRALFGIIAAMLMILAFADLMSPLYVFALSVVAGIVRPSDLVIRNSLTIPR